MPGFSSTHNTIAPGGGDVYSAQTRRTFAAKSGSELCSHIRTR